MSNGGKWLSKKEFHRGIMLALEKANMINIENKWFIDTIDTKLYKRYVEEMSDWSEDGVVFVTLKSNKASRPYKYVVYFNCDMPEWFEIKTLKSWNK